MGLYSWDLFGLVGRRAKGYHLTEKMFYFRLPIRHQDEKHPGDHGRKSENFVVSR